MTRATFCRSFEPVCTSTAATLYATPYVKLLADIYLLLQRVLNKTILQLQICASYWLANKSEYVCLLLFSRMFAVGYRQERQALRYTLSQKLGT